MMKHASSRCCAALLTALSAWIVGPALAQEGAAPGIALELNRAEDVEGGCRIYLVTANGLDEALDPLTLDLVAFDPDGVIVSRLAVDLSPVPPGKTMVRLFDIAGPSCAGLSALLVNDVVACTAGAVADRACLGALTVASRAAIDLRL